MDQEATASTAPVEPKQRSAQSALMLALSGRFGLLLLDSLTGILCARTLRPLGRGELAAMILWPVFLCQAFTLGVPSALIYNMKSKPERSRSIVAGAFLLAILASTITIAFGFTILPHWLTHYSHDVVQHAKWFMFAAPLSMAVLLFRSVWEANNQFGKSALSLVMTRILTLCFLIGTLSLHELTSIKAAYIYLLTGIPAIIWMVWEIFPLADWHIGRMLEATRDMVLYGMRSYGIDLCGALSQYIDQALVLGMLSASQMGSYTVCLSLSRILTAVALAASTVLFPRTVGATPRQAVLTAMRTQFVVTIIAGFGAICMMLLGTFALRTLYGHEYAAAAGTLKILIVEALLSGFITIMSQPFMAMGRPGVVTMLQIAGLLFSIPMILYLVPRYGTEGACIALVLSAALRIVLVGFSYRFILPGTIDWRHDPAVIVREFRQQLHARLRRTKIA